MRVNTIQSDTLITQTKVLTDIKTGREAADEVLCISIRLPEQGPVRELRGRLQWEDDLAALREDS